ncbi:hypothetical protein, partial [Roseinatronobacter sp. NSM]|uniref:hypothetical protein n=1 Tax=Roseinatronobacter sp. NSM TaxID=3457785 RepID=UPI00403538DC
GLTADGHAATRKCWLIDLEGGSGMLGSGNASAERGVKRLGTKAPYGKTVTRKFGIERLQTYPRWTDTHNLGA